MMLQFFKSPTTAAEIDLRLVKPLLAILTTAKNGVDIEIKEHKRRRTTDQNSFYWLNMTDVAKTLNDAGATYGEHALPYTAELVHEINKRLFGQKTTAKMSTQEFSDYMTQVFAFWIEKTYGFFIPKESPQSYLERTGLIEKEK